MINLQEKFNHVHQNVIHVHKMQNNVLVANKEHFYLDQLVFQNALMDNSEIH